jgi:hypothetical protein
LTNVAVVEGRNVRSELMMAIRMSYMNHESSDEWICSLIYALRLVSVEELLVECDKLWPLWSPGPVSQRHETGQPDKIFETVQSTLNWDTPS